MSINVAPDGTRSVQVEIDVPGTPEHVWEAIATLHGISSWFMPTNLEEERSAGASRSLERSERRHAVHCGRSPLFPRRFA